MVSVLFFLDSPHSDLYFGLLYLTLDSSHQVFISSESEPQRLKLSSLLTGCTAHSLTYG